MIDWISCECGAWLTPDWARCHNCGLLNEDFDDNDHDILGGDKMPKKYLDLKGNVGRTPFGIKITIYIPDEMLEHLEVKRKEFEQQKTGEKVSPAQIEDERQGMTKPLPAHPVWVSDHTKKQSGADIKTRFNEVFGED